MLNLSWANEMAKAALKNAQQKIDSVLDIKAEETEQLQAIPDEGLETSQENAASTSQIALNNEIGADSEAMFSDFLSMGFGKTPVSEDERSCDINLDMHDMEMESQQTISNEPVLPPTISRQSSVLDEASTVVSSDIEVVRQMDTWSIDSSRAYESHNDQNSYKNDISSLQIQLKHNKQREIDFTGEIDKLTNINNTLSAEIEQLKAKLSKVSQELQAEKIDREELIKEGQRQSDYSSKQSKEIRRLKNEMGELSKARNGIKRLREEKMEMSDHTAELIEQIVSMTTSLKERDDEITFLRAEIDANHERISEMEEEKNGVAKHYVELFDTERKTYMQTIEHYKNDAISASLERERAYEARDGLILELDDAREEIRRLGSNSMEIEQNGVYGDYDARFVAESIAIANGPLLDMIGELQVQLVQEREISAEADNTIRLYSNQLAEFSENQKQMRIKAEQDRLFYQSQLEQSEGQKKVLLQENSSLTNELKDLQNQMELLKQEMKQAEENFSLSIETALEDSKEAINALIEERDNLRNELQDKQNLIASTISTISNESENVHFEKQQMFDKKQMDVVRLEVQRVRLELKETTAKYNQLLEIDGEKLEKIEELQQDIIDLRKLIKQQSLDFASRHNELNTKMN